MGCQHYLVSLGVGDKRVMLAEQIQAELYPTLGKGAASLFTQRVFHGGSVTGQVADPTVSTLCPHSIPSMQGYWHSCLHCFQY